MMKMSKSSKTMKVMTAVAISFKFISSAFESKSDLQLGQILGAGSSFMSLRERLVIGRTSFAPIGGKTDPTWQKFSNRCLNVESTLLACSTYLNSPKQFFNDTLNNVVIGIGSLVRLTNQFHSLEDCCVQLPRCCTAFSKFRKVVLHLAN